jgi:hypothetical protein
MEPTNLLRRYTSLPGLMHVLQESQITLLSPSTWDDKNDAHFMNEYKRRKKLKTVLAACFTQADETYHHWKVFTHASEGVCIIFDGVKLLNSLKEYPNLISSKMTYSLIADAERKRPSADHLPFLKRKPYGDEKEFRLVYYNKTVAIESMSFDISLNCIKRINLSPWMPKSLVQAVKSTLLNIPGCADLEIYRTTLLESERWKQVANPAASARKQKGKKSGS